MRQGKTPEEHGPVIPPGLRPRLKPLDFGEPKRVGGYVFMKAPYTNGVRQRFVVTIAAAARHRRALVAYAEELQVWLRAEQAEKQGDKPSQDSADETLPRLLKRLAREVPGSHVAFTVEPRRLPGIRAGAPIDIYWRVDPTVAKGGTKSYAGPDDVILAVIRNSEYPNSRVDLKGLTKSPYHVEVGPAARRDANYYCSVTGINRSKFTIDAKQGQGNWVPV